MKLIQENNKYFIELKTFIRLLKLFQKREVIR